MPYVKMLTIFFSNNEAVAIFSDCLEQNQVTDLYFFSAKGRIIISLSDDAFCTSACIHTDNLRNTFIRSSFVWRRAELEPRVLYI